ncbi:PQQ-binding-like beta-propeller repeat protein, partial [Microbispora corallina]|uniref:outer membrane protein assembly factor BamB family protein n=1 Tax=Microbispora corallina TaxID=83302 RepID=UPI0031D3D720
VLPAIAAARPGAAASHAAGTSAAASLPATDAPPEWGSTAGVWAGHNYDLANTRATKRTSITSKNVAGLKVKWRFALDSNEFFGTFSSNPIVVGGTVYLIDLNSKVSALDQATGRVKWQRSFDSPNVGPNGVAYGWGLLFGTTHTGVFALDPRTGATVWSRELVKEGDGGVDIAPQLYDRTVVVSTVPSTLTTYAPGSMGTVWAFDAATGTPKWSFNTIKDGYLWGHPEINSGGGLWFPPGVDDRGRVFVAVGDPAPFPGTSEYPNGASRPGPNLYTNSLVALDGKTGKVLWYQQVAPHDLRDYDLHISPIITYATLNGVRTEVVVVAGKMGSVHAYRADDGKPLWSLPVGRHQNDTGPLPDQPVQVYPGIFGGVQTPMSVSDGRLFVPWVDASSPMSSTSYDFPDLASGTGGILAVDVATGKVLWKRDLPSENFGAATVANDVVFTSTYDGTIYGLDVRTGKTLWSTTTKAGINSFPAVVGDTLYIGAASPIFFDQPVPEFLAYSLS